MVGLTRFFSKARFSRKSLGFPPQKNLTDLEWRKDFFVAPPSFHEFTAMGRLAGAEFSIPNLNQRL
jgi:hypothetical protein